VSTSLATAAAATNPARKSVLSCIVIVDRGFASLRMWVVDK
jgi:hypothetical protein